MRRPGLGTGVGLIVLGAVSLAEAWRLRDALAALGKMGIRK